MESEIGGITGLVVLKKKNYEVVVVYNGIGKLEGGGQKVGSWYQDFKGSDVSGNVWGLEYGYGKTDWRQSKNKIHLGWVEQGTLRPGAMWVIHIDIEAT